MNLRILYMLVGAALLMAPGAFAADEPSLRSEKAHPDSTQQASPGPHIDFNKRVQEKLRALGFYTGPINGDIGPYTQAALAQFQLSVPIPASGQLDEQTVAALGIERDATTSGSVSEGSAGATPAQSADEPGANVSAGSSSNVEPNAQGPELRGTCDRLLGTEKERCLQQGGT
jgi:peptidoglycan hydrolase-like protein with peptidoglycan-binding domain